NLEQTFFFNVGGGTQFGCRLAVGGGIRAIGCDGLLRPMKLLLKVVQLPAAFLEMGRELPFLFFEGSAPQLQAHFLISQGGLLGHDRRSLHAKRFALALQLKLIDLYAKNNRPNCEEFAVAEGVFVNRLAIDARQPLAGKVTESHALSTDDDRTM